MRRLIKKIASKYNIDIEFSKSGKLKKYSRQKFVDGVNWFEVSSNEVLSEDFIREFKDYVSWNCMVVYQNISPKFAKEFEFELKYYL